MNYKLLTIGMCAIFVIFWSHYGTYTYNAYLDNYYDIGIESSSFYQHITCNASQQFNYLPVFGNHQSPTLLLFLPLFALLPDPTTLMAIQAVFLALAAILVFLIGKQIIKSEKIGLALAIAFLINPGVSSIAMFDFHAEAFIPFFVLLSFYLYMTKRPKLFLLSLLPLVGLLDVYTYFIAGMLVLALIVYEWKYGDKSQMKLLGSALLVIFLLGIANQMITAQIIANQPQVSTLALPPILRLAYPPITLNGVVGGNSPGVPITFAAIGTLIVLFGYGFSSLFSIIPGLIMFAPWLKGAFISPANFAIFGLQYYGFVAGASVVAAAMGLLILRKKGKLNEAKMPIMILGFALICSLLVALISPILILSTAAVTLQIVNSTTAFNNMAGASLVTAMNLIPRNASVMAQEGIAPHLFYICNLEYALSETSSPISDRFATYVPPEYVIADQNVYDYKNFTSTRVFNMSAYLMQNYSLIYDQNGAMLYKRVK